MTEPALTPSVRMIDPRPISSDDYRKLLAKQQWTHVRAGRVLGISERTSKVYAAHGVPSGLAAVALRSLVNAEPGELTGPTLEALQDVARRAGEYSRQIKALARGLERLLAEIRAAGPGMPLEEIDDPRLLYGPPDSGEPAVPEPKVANKRKPATRKSAKRPRSAARSRRK